MTEAELDAWLERYARLVVDCYDKEKQRASRDSNAGPSTPEAAPAGDH